MNWEGFRKKLSWHLRGWTEDNHENPARKIDVLGDIRTKSLPNKILQYWRYTKLLVIYRIIFGTAQSVQ
jgi:hypothetical protein